ncbi:GNAT family N-acetyltransferase [Sulfitobacter alexandrii]|uniref:GNAT family N-acetyltransferase n=1 Tax=Sulfitobacter alexandrii TaxID=1917485 RepID=A0A1J0WDH8_9RHOB|nr:GNAT family N-acyltransferase [Sulfitobacter alexandrii]APE42373.1 GNAT family N-acetyltransferase [Sulfitobacter alexandrii]
MDQRVTDALTSVRYRVATESDDLENIYRLRYACYRAEQSISENERGLMTDPFDDTANCVHVAVEMEDKIIAALRLHLVSRLSLASPTLQVFPELQGYVDKGQTILDPTRFVIAPSARKKRVPLHFLALRIPFLAAMFYHIDVALAPVRAEHTAFYQRYLGYEKAFEPRDYPRLNKPIQLLTVNFREQSAAVLKRTPVFGPMEDFPEANISFPPLTGIYAPSKKARTEAA